MPRKKISLTDTPTTSDTRLNLAKIPMQEIGRPGNAVYGDLNWDISERNSEFQFPNSLNHYEEMRSTPIINGLLTILNLAVFGDEWSVVPAAKDTSPVAKQCANELEENIRAELESLGPTGIKYSQNFDDVLRNYLLCLPFGFSFDESVWRYQGNSVRLAKLGPRLPRTVLRFVNDEQYSGNLIAIDQNIFNYSSSTYPRIPFNKITLCSLNKEGDLWQGRSILRPIWQPYTIKDGALRIQAFHIERNGMGVPVIEAQDKSVLIPDQAGLDEMQAIVKNLRGGEYTGCRMAPGWQLRLVGVEGRLPDIVPFLQYLDRQQAISLVMMVLTAGLEGGGAYAQIQTQDDLGNRMVKSIKKQLEGFINSGFVSQWYNYNYDGRCLKPEFKFAHSVDLNLSTLITLVTQLVGSKLFTGDVDDEDYFRAQLNLPTKKQQPPVQSSPTSTGFPKINPNQNQVPMPDLSHQSAVGVPAGDGVAQIQQVQGAFHGAKKGLQPWSPNRKLRPEELSIDCANIMASMDESVSRVDAILKKYLPEMIQSAATRIADTTRVDQLRKIQIPEPEGLVDALKAELQYVAQDSLEKVMTEISKRQRGGTLNA